MDLNETINYSNPLKVITSKYKNVSLIVILFMISFFGYYGLFLFFLGLLYLIYLEKEIGAVKTINLLIFRTIINDGIAINISVVQNIKWIFLLGCSAYLIFNFLKFNKVYRQKISYVVYATLIFFIYNVLSSFVYSTLPIVAAMKAFSFTMVFLGVLCGVLYTKDNQNWLNWLIDFFMIIIFISIVMMGIPIAYLANGISLQGVTNQPNMFGIVCSLALSLVLTRISYANYAKLLPLTIPVIFFAVIMSKSRTSLISCVILISVFYILKLFKKISLFKLSVFFLSAPIILVSFINIFDFLQSFMYKGQSSDNLLYSREEQIKVLLFNFMENPLFGTGFSVPLLSNRYWGFNMNFVVEPGNIIIAVLSFSGIIGFTIFLMWTLSIYMSQKDFKTRNIYLFISPYLISMGEMVFFSSNSIGVFCYMFLTLYIVIDEKDFINQKLIKI